MSTSSLKCVSFQGPASLLAEVLDSDLSFRLVFNNYLNSLYFMKISSYSGFFDFDVVISNRFCIYGFS